MTQTGFDDLKKMFTVGIFPEEKTYRSIHKRCYRLRKMPIIGRVLEAIYSTTFVNYCTAYRLYCEDRRDVLDELLVVPSLCMRGKCDTVDYILMGRYADDSIYFKELQLFEIIDDETLIGLIQKEVGFREEVRKLLSHYGTAEEALEELRSRV